MDETQSENAYEKTAKLAYELWELRGCPEGSPEVDWAAAEEVLASSREVVEKTVSPGAIPVASGKEQPVLPGQARTKTQAAGKL